MQASYIQPRYDSDIQQFFLFYNKNSEPGICGYTKEPNCTFLPFPKLRELFLDHERTTKLLQSVFGFDRPPPIDARNISRGYERIFAILLLIGRGAYIGHFVHSGIDDSRLPLHALPEDVPIPSRDPEFFSAFYKCQWQFCAHTFEKSYNRSQLRNETVLPITSIRVIRTASNADLVQINIHPAYNRLSPDEATEATTYILKRYCVVDAEAYFEAELDAFRSLHLSGSGEGNLTAFYSTFEQHGTYNVLLEFADQGSLVDYFQKTPPLRPEDIQTFWRNLLDVIKALDAIHKMPAGAANGPRVLQGWHGNINPTSILVISKQGGSKFDVHFKLADLGIDHFMTTMASRSSVATSTEHPSRAYDAPECSHEDNAGLSARPEADMWSLGCILSDAVTWVVRGIDGLEDYRIRRNVELEQLGAATDAYCFHDGEIRLQCVDDWHAELLDFKRPTDLITEPIWNMLSEMLGEPDERPTAKQLLAKSRRLLAGTGNLSQRPSQSGGRPLRSRTVGSSTASATSSQTQRELHGPITPPESLFSLGHVQTQPGQPPVPLPQYRDPSPRLMLSRPQQPFFDVAATNDIHDTFIASPISYARSGSSGVPSGSTAPTSPTSPQARSSIRRTQDSLAPRDILSGMQNMRMNSLGSALEFKRQSIVSGATSTSGGADRNDQPSPLEAEGSPRPPESLKRAESPKLPAGDQKPVSMVSEALIRRDSEGGVAPEYSPPSVANVELIPSPLALPARVGSKPNPKAAPFLAVSRLHKWRQDMREKSSSITIDTSERIHLLPADKRDHVFLIDDASSMQAHWLDVTFLFADFTYFIKNLDPDGMTVCFAISLERKKSKATTDFLKVLEKRANVMETAGPSTSNMESRLHAILGDYTARLENEKAPPGRVKHSPFVKKPPPTKPLSLHIYTDGVWQPRCEAENPIATLDKKLEELRVPKTQVAISFVQFGQDEAATRRLQRIEKQFKIVDVEPFKEGNVWKMLNGAIDRRYKEPHYLSAAATSPLLGEMSELAGSPVGTVSRNHSFR
jgi:hypothetical protein